MMSSSAFTCLLVMAISCVYRRRQHVISVFCTTAKWGIITMGWGWGMLEHCSVHTNEMTMGRKPLVASPGRDSCRGFTVKSCMVCHRLGQCNTMSVKYENSWLIQQFENLSVSKVIYPSDKASAKHSNVKMYTNDNLALAPDCYDYRNGKVA